MKKIEQLQEIAAYLLSRKRTNCRFIHIYDYYTKEGNYVFRGCFKCKRTTVVQKVTLDPYGKFIKYD